MRSSANVSSEKTVYIEILSLFTDQIFLPITAVTKALETSIFCFTFAICI